MKEASSSVTYERRGSKSGLDNENRENMNSN